MMRSLSSQAYKSLVLTHKLELDPLMIKVNLGYGIEYYDPLINIWTGTCR
jgi:hypothetical protein